MEPLDEHLAYLSDGARMAAYRSAICRSVKPGSVVVDLGCGTGIFGLLSLEAGARHVFAIDSSPMINVARQVFARAGRSSEVTFIQAHSASVELPEQADVIVSDQIGYFGFDAGVVQYSADAVRRFLKPAGTLIPSRLRLMIAGVESHDAYRPVAKWSEAPDSVQWLREYAVNTRRPHRFRGDELITRPTMLGEVVLQVAPDGLLKWRAELCVTRPGLLHGLVGWFECELAPGVWMTNAPAAERPIDRPQAFLPIEAPTAVEHGCRLDVTILARPAAGLTAWIVRTSSGASFRHSTWDAAPLMPQDVARVSRGRVAQLTPEARARMTILNYCDGRRLARDVEERVLAEHPNLLPTQAELKRFLAHVLASDVE